jgi:hypothetical protein
MRKLFTSALVLTLAFGSQALAQQEAQSKHERRIKLRAEGDVIELMLLRQKAVREDLKLDGQAANKIYEFTYKQQQQASKIHDLPMDEQTPKWETLAKENENFVQTTLTPEQCKRLKEISLQTAGLLCITKKSVAQELNLTKEQEHQAKQLQEELTSKIDQVMEAPDKAGQGEKLAELREASNKKIAELLNPEQQKKWKELTGEAFHGKLIFGKLESEK